MPKNIRVEWRQGPTGLGNAYMFNPNPSPTRVDPALKQAEIDIPLGDGVEVQNLGRAKRLIQLRGVLYAKSKTTEELEDKRKALIDGIGRQVGQLHLISITNSSNPKHVYYTGQITPEGVVFDEQTNPILLDYTINILCADPVEHNISVPEILSGATIIP